MAPVAALIDIGGANYPDGPAAWPFQHLRDAMSDAVTELDAALLALEAEIFTSDPILTESDILIDRVVSKWAASEKKASLAGLVKSYQARGLGALIVNALARSVCRDIELELNLIAKRVKRPHSERHVSSVMSRWRWWLP